VRRGLLAITGGTGFVGSTLIRLATADGWTVRALARRPQSALPGVTWVTGALDQPGSLADLVGGVQAVIHVAGVTNTLTRAGFVAGNIEGTAAMIAAAKASAVSRFIHVSSLSAREPQLSNYGWSKAEAETLVCNSSLDWTMVRPPAIFGPGDTDHLDLFKAARTRIIPLPPQGRLSVIEVSDLGRLLLALVPASETFGAVYDADDGQEGGWSHAAYGRAIGKAAGYDIYPLAVPAAVVRLGARLDRLVRGDKAKLTADRAAYYCHPDWVIDSARRPPITLWKPQIETVQGLRDTAAAYRAAGWL
jgi:uncharacterized protein YbjT (DUF2867 family)